MTHWIFAVSNDLSACLSAFVAFTERIFSNLLFIAFFLISCKLLLLLLKLSLLHFVSLLFDEIADHPYESQECKAGPDDGYRPQQIDKCFLVVVFQGFWLGRGAIFEEFLEIVVAISLLRDPIIARLWRRSESRYLGFHKAQVLLLDRIHRCENVIVHCLCAWWHALFRCISPSILSI